MKVQKINWDILYRELDTVTPLPVDCGRLCGAKCCTEWETGAGVYLLPGEEDMFKGQNWCQLVQIPSAESPFPAVPSFLLRCQGSCPRKKRPLMCRIFPLAPYMDSEGKLKVIFDEDGWLICPLVKLGDMEQLEPVFIQKVQSVWEKLAEHEAIKGFINHYSMRVDKEKNEPWKKLLRP